MVWFEMGVKEDMFVYAACALYAVWISTGIYVFYNATSA